MSRKGQKCFLQVSDWNNEYSRFISLQISWKCMEVKRSDVPGFSYHRHYLLEFNSLAARKYFVKRFCNGRMYGRNQFVTKFSPWPDVPYARLKQDDAMELCEYNYALIYPDISILEFQSPKLYRSFHNLYHHLGFNDLGGVINSRKC